jgi:hypothetical protein
MNHVKQAGKRGRDYLPPNNTFGVSREEREKVMSHKYFSPPTGIYTPKYVITDPNDKITKIVPNGSSPEKDPRFDYSKTNTLFWYPNQRVIEDHKIAFFNTVSKCDKCVRTDTHTHTLHESGSLANSSSPRRDSKDG